ncbi:MAG: dCMP deaminase family protein [Nanoarchaeota archaeon]|nr:dCMP deaminase family protein [Nanoarchaeota archaeon]
MKRPSKTEYYLNIAKAVCKRSTCLLRRYGAVIVKDDTIVSTGYNGPARGVVNCNEVGYCLKEMMGAERGRGYEHCPAVHAEENAIINAARHGSSVLGGIMYACGEDVKTGKHLPIIPCYWCRRVIINAGISKVYTMDENGNIIEYDPKEWIKEDSEDYIKRVEEAKKTRRP